MNEQNTFNYIDAYCERAGINGLFAEPLNLITNIAFVIGAFLLFKFLQKNKILLAKNWDIIFLVVNLAVIGFGSAAYHSIPNAVTLNLDVIPIAIFIHFYLTCFFIRVLGLKPVVAVICLFIFIASGVVFQNNFSPDTLNGTIMYVPTYLTLLLMIGAMCFIKHNPLYQHLITTAIIWTFSLAFRTVDMEMCNYTLEIGTHFLWHLLNAVVLYRLVKLMTLNRG